MVALCAASVLAPAYAATATDGQTDDGLKCNENEERDGNTCYPLCIGDGYTRYEGDGDECLQICPSNSQDFGNKCLMGPAALLKKFYSRGPGRRLK